MYSTVFIKMVESKSQKKQGRKSIWQHKNQTQKENSNTGIQYTMFREYHRQPYHMATLNIACRFMYILCIC